MIKKPIKASRAATKFVFVGPGNNDGLIREYFMNKKGWSLMDSKQGFNTKFSYKWV